MNMIMDISKKNSNGWDIPLSFFSSERESNPDLNKIHLHYHFHRTKRKREKDK